MNILIVDDNEVNRELVSMMLEQDHAITTAGNGLEALTALVFRSFDVILMDVQMPVMDGLSATTIIRAFEKGVPAPKELPDNIGKYLAVKLNGGHMPIVAMTAHAMGEDQERCLSVGMDGHITKPFQANVLASVLQSLVAPPPSLCDNEDTFLASGHTHPSVDTSPPAAKVEHIVSYFKTEIVFSDEQIARLITLSRKSIAGNLGIAEKALKEKNYETLGIAVHTLKGTLLQCGLIDWAEKAQEIHDGIKNKQELPYADRLETIKKGLSELLEDQEVGNIASFGNGIIRG